LLCLIWLVFGIIFCGLLKASGRQIAAGAGVPATSRMGGYNITAYGAVGDGEKNCSEAITRAIDAASARGGGTIYFPAGSFLTGPIHLKSHITLYLESGCVLQFSTNLDDYLPMVPSRWEGIEVTNFSPLIYAQNAEDVAVRGRGTLNGQGQAWWDRLRRQGRGATAGEARDKWQQEFARLNPHPLVSSNYHTLERGYLRPPFIQPYNCTNVLIEGVTIINSPFWTLTPVYCENVTVHAVVIHNPESPNTDGINPDSCHNVHISDCQISVGDDCITIKSGRDADGRRVGRPAEDYTIDNCTMASGHGGVTIGSEASGGVKNITIANCVFDGTDRGIRIKSSRGRGGVIEDVRVSNIVMRNIKNEAVVITSFYERSEPEPVSERTPVFRNIHISGITGDAKSAGELTGLAEMPLENISFTDIHLSAATGLNLTDVKNISLHNVSINAARGPAITADRTAGLELDSVQAMQPSGAAPLADLRNVKNVFIHGCSAAASLPHPVRILAVSASELITEGNNFGAGKIEIVDTAGK
jgi:hypothetical protein